MADFIERLEMNLWKVLGGEEVRPKLFTMRDARRFFYDMLDKYPKADGCVLSVTPKGDRFEVVQLMVDQEGKVLKASADTYVGRKMIAEEIDDTVVAFLDGETRRTMKQ